MRRYDREAILQSHIVRCDPDWEMWRNHRGMNRRILQDDFWGQGNPIWLTQNGLVNLEVLE